MNFIELYRAVDSTTSTLDKVEKLRAFFTSAADEESLLAIRLILGQLPPRRLKTAEVKSFVLGLYPLPAWLFAEAYSATGDLAETLSLISGIPGAPSFREPLSEWIVENMKSQEAVLAALEKAMSSYDSFSVMVLLKLTTGGLRIGVARGILIKALAKAFDIPEGEIAHVLMGKEKIKTDFLVHLRSKDWRQSLDFSSPFPFALASPVEQEISTLGNVNDWSIEWKWDGIRGQWICRDGKISIWSRGEEVMTDRFPELVLGSALSELPFSSIVIDGEVLAWAKDAPKPFPFSILQTRIARKKVSENVLQSAPIRFVAYDCLELDGVDLRERPFSQRREILERVIQILSNKSDHFKRSPVVQESDWESFKTLRSESRERGVEGFILKRKSSPYFHGRKRGDWWKWKIDPMTLDAVLVYAQSGHGKRSNLFTDYTFALRDDSGELVPIAKAYSGLDQSEIMELDRWIRKHTKDRFGPVRSVEPFQVFELAFEGIADSPRHKSGIALRFPRILRWRKDKPLAQIDRLSAIRDLYLRPSEDPSSANG